MPTYLVTDNELLIDVMVEAKRPAGAIQALVSNRFTVSDALETGDALRRLRAGTPFLEEGESVAMDLHGNEGEPLPSEHAPTAMRFGEAGLVPAALPELSSFEADGGASQELADPESQASASDAGRPLFERMSAAMAQNPA